MAPRLKINVKQPPVWSAVEGLHTGMEEQFEAEMQVAAANLPPTITRKPRLSPRSAQSALFGPYATLVPPYSPWLSSVLLITFSH